MPSVLLFFWVPLIFGFQSFSSFIESKLRFLLRTVAAIVLSDIDGFDIWLCDILFWSHVTNGVSGGFSDLSRGLQRFCIFDFSDSPLYRIVGICALAFST
jgi:hypothetical protein